MNSSVTHSSYNFQIFHDYPAAHPKIFVFLKMMPISIQLHQKQKDGVENYHPFFWGDDVAFIEFKSSGGFMPKVKIIINKLSTANRLTGL